MIFKITNDCGIILSQVTSFEFQRMGKRGNLTITLTGGVSETYPMVLDETYQQFLKALSNYHDDVFTIMKTGSMSKESVENIKSELESHATSIVRDALSSFTGEIVKASQDLSEAATAQRNLAKEISKMPNVVRDIGDTISTHVLKKTQEAMPSLNKLEKASATLDRICSRIEHVVSPEEFDVDKDDYVEGGSEITMG